MALLTKVGAFTVTNTLSNQPITGVGFQPKAVIFWSVYRSADDAWSTSSIAMIGMSTGPSNSYSVAAIGLQQGGGTNTASRIAAKALTFDTGGGGIEAEADLISFDSDGFTLDFTNATSGDIRIFYLALGGDDLTHAKVVNWAMPTTTGPKAVTGVGFQPDLILNAWADITAALDDSD